MQPNSNGTHLFDCVPFLEPMKFNPWIEFDYTERSDQLQLTTNYIWHARENLA